jgi:sugar phosphate isomerase/epimerase
MPYVKHIHGKLFEMNKDGNDDCNDWQEIIDYLTIQGYNGYISTEYEGQRYKGLDEKSDEIETVRSHQRLLRKCIENAKGKGE